MDSLETRRPNMCGVGDQQPSPPGRPASLQLPRRKGRQSRVGVSRSEGLPSRENSRCRVSGWGGPGPRLSWFPRSWESAVSEGPWAPVVPRGPSVAPGPSTEAPTPRLPPLRTPVRCGLEAPTVCSAAWLCMKLGYTQQHRSQQAPQASPAWSHTQPPGRSQALCFHTEPQGQQRRQPG